MIQRWYQLFQKKTGLNPYVWIVFYILPFYFIFQSSSTPQIIVGILLILLFLACYVLSVVSRGWFLYVCISMLLLISITMTLLFGYVYFSLFLAFFIGHIPHKTGFITIYTIHLVTTFLTINFGFATQNPTFITQLPFVLLSLIAVILLPVNIYNKNNRDKLEGQLEDAHKRISELVKLEERQRISRDLHDTLGQKLSLIGLKSDLAARLLHQQPVKAQAELKDIRQTARTALKEVRELVTRMRGLRLEEEIHRIGQLLSASQITFELEGEPLPSDLPPLVEHVVSMCLKEAVTNVVKHSGAKRCTVRIYPAEAELTVEISDDGKGMQATQGKQGKRGGGNGLRGMRERLEFVNGSMELSALTPGLKGTTLRIQVPSIIKPKSEVNLS